MSRRSPEPPTAMPNARLSGRRFLRYKRRCCTPLHHQHDKVIGARPAPPQPPLWGRTHNRADSLKAYRYAFTIFLRHRQRFCVNSKCSLERLLTKGQIWRPKRWKYRPATVHFRQSFACGAQVSPAARHFAPFSHALARGRLAWRGGWRRRGGATDSCDGGMHGYTCASGLQWSLPGPPGPATAAVPKEKRA